MEQANFVPSVEFNYYHFDENLKNRYINVWPEKTSDENVIAYCIVSGRETPFDIKRPFCDRHQSETEGMYCHMCGKEAKTSRREPRCDDCIGMCHYLEALYNSKKR